MRNNAILEDRKLIYLWEKIVTYKIIKSLKDNSKNNNDFNLYEDIISQYILSIMPLIIKEGSKLFIFDKFLKNTP